MTATGLGGLRQPDWRASAMAAVALLPPGLCAADLAQLARCAWQRQQAAGEPGRGNREFETLALWNAMGCRQASRE